MNMEIQKLVEATRKVIRDPDTPGADKFAATQLLVLASINDALLTIIDRLPPR